MCISQGWYDNIITVNPHNYLQVYVGGIDMFRSDDGGDTWSVISYWYVDTDIPQYSHADVHVFTWHPDYVSGEITTPILFCGSDGGLYRTDNPDDPDLDTWGCPNSVYHLSGVEFVTLNNGYGTTQFYHGDSARDVDVFIGGTQDNGTNRGKTQTTNCQWDEVLGGDGGYVQISPLNSDVVYAESQNFPSIQKSTDGGDSFVDATNGITDSDGLFITPFALDPSDPNVMWSGGRRPWRTRDAAANWELAITYDPNGDPNAPSVWEAPSPSPDQISAIAIAPSNSNIVYMGTDNGWIVKTTQGDQPTPPDDWVALGNAQGLRADDGGYGAFVSSIAVDPTDPLIAYCTYSSFKVDPNSDAHVYRTEDGGDIWVSLDGYQNPDPNAPEDPNVIPDIPCHWIAIKPDDPAVLYVGTEMGVFISEDTGQNWSRSDGVPYTVVETLDFQNPDDPNGNYTLVAFTHGRGAFTAHINRELKDTVLSGEDVYHAVTDANGVTSYDFSGDPIDPNFFGPGSQSFDGVIELIGDPIKPASGTTDTIVRRPDRAEFPGTGSPETAPTIPTEVVRLNLKSVAPISVGYPDPNGADPSFYPGQKWDVRVVLSDYPKLPGTIDITKDDPNGGTFAATLEVKPKLIFTRVCNPNDIRILDLGDPDPTSYMNLSAANVPWVVNIDPDPNTAPNVLRNGDGNFVPGVDGTVAPQIIQSATYTDPNSPLRLRLEPAGVAESADPNCPTIPESTLPSNLVGGQWSHQLDAIIAEATPYPFTGYPSDESLPFDPNYPYPRFVAHQFFCSTTLPVTKLRWWGGYVSNDTPPPADDFIIRIYEDDTCQPGTEVEAFSQSDGMVNNLLRVPTGRFITLGFQGREYVYSADLDNLDPNGPLTLTPGQLYWLEIANNTAGDQDDDWIWVTSRDPLGLGAGSPDHSEWYVDPPDNPFCPPIDPNCPPCPDPNTYFPPEPCPPCEERNNPDPNCPPFPLARDVAFQIITTLDTPGIVAGGDSVLDLDPVDPNEPSTGLSYRIEDTQFFINGTLDLQSAEYAITWKFDEVQAEELRARQHPLPLVDPDDYLDPNSDLSQALLSCGVDPNSHDELLAGVGDRLVQTVFCEIVDLSDEELGGNIRELCNSLDNGTREPADVLDGYLQIQGVQFDDMTARFIVQQIPCGDDCNEANGEDCAEVADDATTDCNMNFRPDVCDITDGILSDGDGDGIPDICDIDCDDNGLADICDISCGDPNGPCDIEGCGTGQDCNNNITLDVCEVPPLDPNGPDCNSNSIPDECEPDCNNNGTPDDCDIDDLTSRDCQPNGTPDECDIASGDSGDCNGNTIPDGCEIDSGGADDCNQNGVIDLCEISIGDCNDNDTPDVCEIDENSTAPGGPYYCTENCDPDCNNNGIPDACEEDCNQNETPDVCEIDETSPAPGGPYFCTEDCADDCNDNGTPDECEINANSPAPGGPYFCTEDCAPDCNTNGTPDECDIDSGASEDCNYNLTPDECDIIAGTSPDCQPNGTPDECDISTGGSNDFIPVPYGDGIPDECQPDMDGCGDPNAGLPYFDENSDCDVDLGDFLAFQACFAGPGTPVGGDCVCFDGDRDGDVDLQDFFALQTAYTGPGEDCNNNGTADQCDISSGTSQDCQPNDIPDECDIDDGDSRDFIPVPDGDGIPDECQPDMDGCGDPHSGLPHFDANSDCDVDLGDFLAFQTCFAGPDTSVGADCICFDGNDDGDVDLSDFLAFQTTYTGPGTGCP